MLGDSRAPALALIICLHTERLSGAEGEVSGMAAHRSLCLRDLGLATARKPGLIAIKDFGDPDLFAISKERLDAWKALQLAPFGGELTTAADFVLQLALARTGLGKEPLPAWCPQ
jgi:hypothetical protein